MYLSSGPSFDFLKYSFPLSTSTFRNIFVEIPRDSCLTCESRRKTHQISSFTTTPEPSICLQSMINAGTSNTTTGIRDFL